MLPNGLRRDLPLGKLARIPLRLIPRSIDLPIMTGVLKGMRWRVGALTHGCWIGIYESEKQSAVARHVKPGMKVFDVGAHSGYYTLLFSKLVGDEGHVFAFEPLAHNVVNLLHHREVNKLANTTVVQAAVSSGAGVIPFEIAKSSAMGRMSAESVLHVPTVSIDELTSKYGYPRPDLIKMDVEGAEGLVLEGARALLEARTCIIFVALHGTYQTKRCAEILTDCGYVLHDLSQRPLTEIPQNVDEIYATPKP